MIDKQLESIVNPLSKLSFVEGVVLGGSRATGTASAGSDTDIGVYYRKGALDLAKLNAAAKELDDEHRENLICPEGGWGNWVNCGGWLTIGGEPVDLILRDIERVRTVLEDCERGVVTSHYQTGHPHAYISVMYRGELALSEVLYSRSESFTQLKYRAQAYPPRMKKTLLDFYLFEARFSCDLAMKSAQSGDLYYVSGQVFRAVSALNQVLFALNEEYCLNEKKAVFRIDTFPKRPAHYSGRCQGLFELTERSAWYHCLELGKLVEEVAGLCGRTISGGKTKRFL